MSLRTAAWLAWGLWGLAVSLSGLALALQILNWSSGIATPLLTGLGTALLTLWILAFPTVGALIAARQPSHPLGWTFCTLGVGFAVVGTSWGYATYALVIAPGSLPGGEVMAWLSVWPRPGLGMLAVLLPQLVFPDGRLPSRRWRPVAWLFMAELIVLPTALALQPGPLQFSPVIVLPAVANPFGVRGPAGEALRLVTVGAWVSWRCSRSRPPRPS